MTDDTRESVDVRGAVACAVTRAARLSEGVPWPGAEALIRHLRPKDWRRNPRTGLLEPDYRWRAAPGGGQQIDPESAELLDEQHVHNVVTTVGRDFLHLQGYGSSGLGANGLNYIALSNSTLTETSASTTLSGEIAANGLTRAQGTVAHTVGTAITTVDRTFTCATAQQGAQKGALFTASSSGIMCHALAFTQRILEIADSLQTTWTITLG